MPPKKKTKLIAGQGTLSFIKTTKQNEESDAIGSVSEFALTGNYRYFTVCKHVIPVLILWPVLDTDYNSPIPNRFCAKWH